MIGLGPESRDVMRLHWRHMTLFRLTFPKRYSYNAQQKRVNIFAFIDCNYRVGCSCNVSEMWAETVSCAFSEALWRHATPVRDLLLTISSIVFELETCVKKGKSSIFHALSLCGQTFLCRMNISHRYLAKTAFFANINTTTEPLPSPFFHPSNFCLFFYFFWIDPQIYYLQKSSKRNFLRNAYFCRN